MKQYPREECADANYNIQKLNGISITKGFTKAVKDAIGGTKGCSHVTNCILAMGPAACSELLGYESSTAVSKEFDSCEPMSQYLIDTCHVWRKDGLW